MIYAKDYVSKLLSIAQNDEDTEPVFVRVSQVMLSHLQELGEIQNRQLAEWCYVDASTISRFVKYLGFINFGEFKDYFKEYNEINNISHYFDFTKIGNNLPSKALVDSTVEALNASYTMVDLMSLEKIGDFIEQYPEIILCGDRYSQLAAEDFQLRLLSLGYYAKTFKDVTLQ